MYYITGEYIYVQKKKQEHETLLQGIISWWAMVSIHRWKRLLSCWDGFHHGTSDFQVCWWVPDGWCFAMNGSWLVMAFKTCQNRLTKKWQALSSKPSPMLWCLNSFRNAGGAAQNQLFQDTCETTSKGRGLVLSLELTMARRNPWDTINCLNWRDWWPNGKDSSIWRVWWYCSIKTRVQKASCSFFHLLPDDWTDYLWPFFAHIHIYLPIRFQNQTCEIELPTSPAMLKIQEAVFWTTRTAISTVDNMPRPNPLSGWDFLKSNLGTQVP